jgi:NAD-dependent SIR2 family protein deacetylase
MNQVPISWNRRRMVEKIKVHCTRCRNFFKESIKNLRSGNQSSCPSCGRLILFEENSDDVGIRRAMTEARRRKYALMAQPSSQCSWLP